MMYILHSWTWVPVIDESATATKPEGMHLLR